ncbi:hypothetical protein IE988_08645 [Klebsiella pneumoniae]|uniref:Uncharacterized protein n=1 Tax=Klebsiella pneumoniae TaxID=573 RepID=A0A927DWE5_KLEPN|nr:hypothetical protein [Klebsiella pneumoniae]
MASGTELLLCRVAAAPYPAYSSGSDCLRCPASNCAAGRWHQARSCVYTGWRLRLYPAYSSGSDCLRCPASNCAAGAMASDTELR